MEGSPLPVAEVLLALQHELDGFELCFDTEKGDTQLYLTVTGVLTAEESDKL
ncbi:hypothetical protein [Streptomyces erythrochromogenes]|uniref:hypothetical protein n=1 Tax=Streptomyces erythrochromogenes TaxID=285574 RepID=UPI00368FCD8B